MRPVRSTAIAGTAAASLLAAASCVAAEKTVEQAAGKDGRPAARPNIIFIMADDHASQAISAYGSRIMQTPNIDRIAARGMRFDNCFCTNAICAPSRAVILSGKYSHLNGVTMWQAFDGRQTTLPKVLQANGYHTGIIGKWHLDNTPTGFDDWKILVGQGEYYDPVFLNRPAGLAMGAEDGFKPAGKVAVKQKITGYCTDIITDLAVDFLDKRPKDKPFFLMVHHKAPHRNWLPAPKYKTLFDDRNIPEPPTLFDDYSGRLFAAAAQMRMTDLRPKIDLKADKMPKFATKQEEIRWRYQRYIKDYLRCVKSVDDSVGRVLDYLEKNGLAENTLIVYTSDQGFFLGEHSWFDKRWMYEESLQMPFLACMPGTVPAKSVSKSMVINADFAPTFLALAGIPAPAEMQGRSFLTQLEGQGEPKEWRTSVYYHYYDPAEHHVEPHYGVRTATHKLIFYPRTAQYELFDLRKDPDEMKSVAGDPACAKVLEQLKAELARLRAELKDTDDGKHDKKGTKDAD